MGTTAVQASIAGEAGGGTVLISTDEGCLIRVTLSSGVGSRLSCQYQSSGPFAVDGSGSVAYLGDPARLLKTYLAPTVQTVAIGLDGAVDIDVEAGDTTAIVALMGAFAGPPSVVRLSLATGVSSFIATPPRFGIYGLRVDAAGVNAYVVGDDNYIDRVVLASGAVSEVTNLLTGVSVHQLAIEAGDSTALITAVGNLYRVSLGTGAVTSVSGCCALASDPVVEPDGHSVLTGGVSGQYLARSDLLTGLTVTLFNNLRLDGSARAECSAIALEGDGHHLLMAQPGTFGQPNFQGRLIRIDLLTRAVTVIASGLQGLGNSYCGTNGIALETGGGSLLVTSDDGVIRRITLPLAN